LGKGLPLGHDLRILNVDKIYIRERVVGCGKSEIP
jgi:hypothetical protein